jgi:arabinofuranosyltransferase
LFAPSRKLTAPPYRHVSKGHGLAFTWRDEAAAGGEHVRLANGIGYLGYWCGPRVHLVDPMGLSDVLLARLAVISNGLLVEPDKNRFRNRPWRIGHFYRHIPEGYLESLADPTKPLTDPRIGDLRDRLDLITRGDLWSERRWSAIVELNFR